MICPYTMNKNSDQDSHPDLPTLHSKFFPPQIMLLLMSGSQFSLVIRSTWEMLAHYVWHRSERQYCLKGLANYSNIQPD